MRDPEIAPPIRNNGHCSRPPALLRWAWPDHLFCVWAWSGHALFFGGFLFFFFWKKILFFFFDFEHCPNFFFVDLLLFFFLFRTLPYFLLDDDDDVVVVLEKKKHLAIIRKLANPVILLRATNEWLVISDNIKKVKNVVNFFISCVNKLFL